MDEDKGIQRFGDYLKALRHERRLTLERIEELSRRWPAPITKTWLSRCEHAQTEPTIARLTSLARIYRIRLGEIAERYEIEQALARQRPAPPRGRDEPSGALDDAGTPEEERALILFEAACRAEGTIPSAADPPSRAGEISPGRIDTLAGEPPPEPAPERDRESGPSPTGASRLSEARSRLCLAVLSASTGNYRVCREEAEALFGASDLPEDIRLRAAIQLAYAWRKLRRAPLARLLLSDLLAPGEAVPPRIQADAHLLLGCLDLDDGQSRAALLHLRKASGLYREHGTPGDLARSLQELGEAYRLSGRLPDAMMRYQEGWTIARQSGLRPLVADLESHLGRGHFLLGQHAMAGRVLRESTEAARRTDAWDVLFRNAWYLRALAARAGDEFSRRTCERTLRRLLSRADPFSEEALRYRREVAQKEGRKSEETDEHDSSPARPLSPRRTLPASGGILAGKDSDASTEGVRDAAPPVPPPRYRPLGRPVPGETSAEVVPLARKRNRDDRIVRAPSGTD